MSEQQQDARHPATHARLIQAHRDGEIVRSQELAAAIQLVFGFIAVWFLIHALISGLSDFSMEMWSTRDIAAIGSIDGFQRQISESLFRIAVPLVPLLGLLFVIVVLSQLIQSGAVAVSGRSMLRTQNMNPMNGIQRLLSIRNLTRGILGVPKIAIVMTVALGWLWSERFRLADLQQLPTEVMVNQLIQILFKVLMSAAVTLLVISLSDYLIERFSFLQRMRMSDQQLRDENRMQGPVPQVAASRNRFYRDF